MACSKYSVSVVGLLGFSCFSFGDDIVNVSNSISFNVNALLRNYQGGPSGFMHNHVDTLHGFVAESDPVTNYSLDTTGECTVGAKADVRLLSSTPSFLSVSGSALSVASSKQDLTGLEEYDSTANVQIQTRFTLLAPEVVHLRFGAMRSFASGSAESRVLMNLNGDFYSSNADVPVLAGTNDFLTVSLVADANAGRSPSGSYGDTAKSASGLDYSFSVGQAPTPEPGAIGVLGIGLLGLIRKRRRTGVGG